MNEPTNQWVAARTETQTSTRASPSIAASTQRRVYRIHPLVERGRWSRGLAFRVNMGSKEQSHLDNFSIAATAVPDAGQPCDHSVSLP